MDPRLEKRALTPRYSFREASGLVDRAANTVRRWSVGNRRRHHEGQIVLDDPLIAIDGDPGTGPPLSFLNLLELKMLSAYRDEATLRAIRRALEFAATQLGQPRPLLTMEFHVLGGRLFTDFAKSEGLLLNMTDGGQVALVEWVRSVTDDIEYQNDVAKRWWYHSRRVPLLVDTAVAAGHPITSENGVRVDAITSRVVEGLTDDEIAEDTGASLPEIRAVHQNHAAA